MKNIYNKYKIDNITTHWSNEQKEQFLDNFARGYLNIVRIELGTLAQWKETSIGLPDFSKTKNIRSVHR